MKPLDVIKWLAIIAMTIDHINAAWFWRAYPLMYDVGRVAMPLFAGLLAYNLSRPGAMERGVYRRVLVRLLVFGGLAYPFHVLALGQGWATLNIMFAFAAGVASIWAIERATPWSVTVWAVCLLVAPLVLEFHWAGPLLMVAMWQVGRGTSWTRWALLAVAMTVLCIENGNAWALGALPLLAPLLRHQDYPQRSRWASWGFYVYYPAHLAFLVLVSPELVCKV